MVSETSATRIDWVRQSCRLLAAISDEYSRTRPFAGKSIGTGIHLEPKTAALLLTLKAGGAEIIATGNLSSTQPETVEYLRTHDITVHAEQTTDPERHKANLRKVLWENPDLLLDNGGDLFSLYLDAPYFGLLGGTEETTSGRHRLYPLRHQLSVPILVINDSPIKQFAENRHGVGQSMFESYLRLTNRSTQGKRVTVLGYGPCGQGVAAAFRNAYSIVSVLERDPVKRLEAHLDGYLTPGRETALLDADVLVTETGAEAVITNADLQFFKDGVVLMNGGHFPTEIDVPGLYADKAVTEISDFAGEGLHSLTLSDGRKITLVAGGHMANLAGARPQGNSIEAMDLGFALQARCLERIATGQVTENECVVPVPPEIDAAVAQAFLDIDG